jgi:ABC-type Fe3+-siderophore transport system permease subunit
LIVWIKAHPGEVLVGTAGVGSVSHVSGIYLQNIIAKPLVTPQVLGTFQKAEIEKWWPIVKAANIKAE